MLKTTSEQAQLNLCQRLAVICFNFILIKNSHNRSSRMNCYRSVFLYMKKNVGKNRKALQHKLCKKMLSALFVSTSFCTISYVVKINLLSSHHIILW